MAVLLAVAFGAATGGATVGLLLGALLGSVRLHRLELAFLKLFAELNVFMHDHNGDTPNVVRVCRKEFCAMQQALLDAEGFIGLHGLGYTIQGSKHRSPSLARRMNEHSEWQSP